MIDFPRVRSDKGSPSPGPQPSSYALPKLFKLLCKEPGREEGNPNPGCLEFCQERITRQQVGRASALGARAAAVHVRLRLRPLHGACTALPGRLPGCSARPPPSATNPAKSRGFWPAEDVCAAHARPNQPTERTNRPSCVPSPRTVSIARPTAHSPGWPRTRRSL